MLTVLAAWSLAPAGARGAEVTRVVTAFDGENRFDFNLTLGWLHDAKSGFVKRESQSMTATHTELIKDLKYAQTRDTLNLRADVGILWDVGFHIEAPLVLGDVRTLDFDQSAGGDCAYPGNSAGLTPTCVNEQNSTILRDGILPGYGMLVHGQDAQHNRPFNSTPNGAMASPGNYSYSPSGVFRGPVRRGFENLGLGV